MTAYLLLELNLKKWLKTVVGQYSGRRIDGFLRRRLVGIRVGVTGRDVRTQIAAKVVPKCE